MNQETFFKKYFSWIFFSIYLVVGLLIFSDYGMSWDEELNRIGTANPEYNYVVHDNAEKLVAGSDKYHGPSFELLLFSAERMLNLSDTRQIYFLRHFITFFFFWLSSIFLFLLARNIFKGDGIAILCLLMYVLSPRIFGESFYNSKDLGFLSFFTISLYTLQRFLSEKKILFAFLHALATGFMIDIRITGVIVPIVTVAFFVIDIFLSDNKSPKMSFVLIVYFIFQFSFIVLFWPVLWLGPFHHLNAAFAEMKNFPWQGSMLFMGELIPAQHLPWYYLPLWIMITIPFLYTLLFFSGMFFLIAGFFKTRLNFLKEHLIVFALLSLATIPILAIIIFGSSVYDGWRHLYFVYSPMVIIAGFGGMKIYDLIIHSSLQKKIVTGILIVQFTYLIVQMIMDHPHQNVYFNLPARMVFNPILQNFEGDYWGLSYRKGLEEILAKDTAQTIHVRVENDPGLINLEMLKPEDRARINFHIDPRIADYWLAEFRGREVDPEKVDAKMIEQIKSSSGTLLTLYKGDRQNSPMSIVSNTQINFDDTVKRDNLTSEKSFSGKFSQLLEPSFFSSEISFPIDTTNEKEFIEYQISVNVNSSSVIPELIIYLTVRRNDSTVYWARENMQNRISADHWIPFRWNMILPDHLVHAGDVVKAGIWNISDSKVFIDDFGMRVARYSVRRAPMK
jgi:hypothetical protein